MNFSYFCIAKHKKNQLIKSMAKVTFKSYNPRMLLKVIVYAYLNNVYSGRKMERLLVENIAFMWLSGMQTPDFRTINLFRSKRLAGKFDSLFTQVVLLLNEEGFVSLDVQYIDGTKIESVANKYTFVWKGSVEKNKSRLEAKVRSVLETAEQALALEGNEPEEELSSEETARRAEAILDKMDRDGISDKKMRKAVEKVKTEFGLVALAHNIRKYISMNRRKMPKDAEAIALTCHFLPLTSARRHLNKAC